MKRIHFLFGVLLVFGLISTVSVVRGQEVVVVVEEEESAFSTGADLYSNYIFRGVKYGQGPSFQPYVEAAVGGFAIGAWGAFDASGFAESDLYLAYGFDFGLSLGVTDYYYPGSDYSDFSEESGSHAIEINLGYEIGGLALAANYIVNEAGSAGSVGGDMYYEIGYAFDNVGFFFGVGDGWHTSDTEFDVVNVGLSTSKDIKITDSFTLPVSGSVIWNPDAKQQYVVVGVSF
jgi:hypothetical protein